MFSTILLVAASVTAAQDTGSTALPSSQAMPDSGVRMDNPRNPLIAIQTSQGDIQIELFQDAAPQNVQFFLDLAAGQAPVAAAGSNLPTAQPYYDGMTFHRVIRDTLIPAGPPARAGRQRPISSVIDEINARGLGLEQQSLLDASGKPHPWLNIGDQADFKQHVLLPLYRDMNINNEQALQPQQGTVLQRLQAMNLLQFHEMVGYRYDGSLPSRRPARGSVMMVNRGPGSNDGEFFIALTDMPWLTGTTTVIGRVASGLQTVERISQSPAASTRILQVRQLNDLVQTGE
jgi:peptidyl-prolyl cis-trans isomerase A (cyclophilin A)